MLICCNCVKEMTCTKTGRTAVFGGCHCYRGDEFTCKDCGAVIITTNPLPYHDPHARSEEGALIMTKEVE